MLKNLYINKLVDYGNKLIKLHLVHWLYILLNV